MKRWSGLAVGLGLMAAGTVGGVAWAAAHGTSVRPATSGAVSPGGSGASMSAMMGGGSTGGMAAAMNQYMGNTHAVMGYVGSGGSGMMAAASGSVWTPGHVAALVQQSERGVTIDRATNTITYHNTQDLLVPLAAPAALHLPGMQWEIDGLINPTVVVPQGAHVTVDLVNADQGYMHGFEVTKATPPFQEMAMMQGTAAFSGSFVMPILPETSQGQYHRSTQFTAATAGTYHYICPVPGHAAHGMVGQFVVS
ncbi:hypothetical protein [Sulfobacillus harzensis]|uniref:Rusticyanin n=1 Tax=Sulfobacillus harzensis TaxID=2729629 RepID=A0A7Y0L1M7_9FIRM|nr:hypothetical protein [Sulfobacillus harzensis]NMP21565.1 hypothetical protein [Sulfobacillus harzensis]